MQLRSTAIVTNPRSYEATLDEFLNLFPAFKEPDNQFVTPSYHAFKSIKFTKKTNVWFSRYRHTSGFRVHFTHTSKRITLTQIDSFLGELDTFLDNSYKNLKNKLIPVNSARNKSGNPPEQLRPENCHFLILWSNVTKCRYIHIYIFHHVRT